MRKLGLLKLDSMGDYEKEKGYASYRTIVERFIGDIVLCNNIAEVDDYIFDNMKYDYDEYGDITSEHFDIYQYYLCHISDYEEEQLIKAGFILSYSDILDCDILCVNHYGTSWDYVLTNVKLFDTYEELEKYEKEEN